VASFPAEEYTERLGRLRSAAARLARVDARFSQTRLVLFGAGAVLALLWWRGGINVAWPILSLVAFAGVIPLHARAIRRAGAVARTIAFYERGLARIEDRWAGSGETGERFGQEHHPYAHDLDIFGSGSLFQLLSSARTRAGEETLAAWLARPTSAADIRGRQDAVTELASALDLRETLALAGADVGATVDTDNLVAWAEAPRALTIAAMRALAVVFTVAVLAAASYGFATGNYGVAVGVMVAQALFSIPQRARIQHVLHAADGPARDLDVVAHVLARLERETFTSPRLAALRHELDTSGVHASTAIRRLHRLVEWHDWQHNQFFAPLGAALLWGTHLAWAIESWRGRHGRHVRAWLRLVGEFEALSSLAAYRYEHPDDVWPEMVEGGALFEATSLGHPLLPRGRMVRNDVALSTAAPLLIVSGSNMSGKSTLLRTVGINAVMAQAGAPVRAQSLRLSPLAVGATLRIQDSLQEGKSRFYAEITRIRELSDAAAGPLPLLFLLDELFHGTNSHDRMAGAAGVLRSLVDRGAIGLITTHDLALTSIAADLGPRAVNVHFEDHFEAGRIEFDYCVKPGPVTRSNAIALMRAVGLDVPAEQ
jgi:hypothetical protein